MQQGQEAGRSSQVFETKANAVSLLLEVQRRGFSIEDLQEANQLILSQQKILPVWVPYDDGIFRGKELKHIRSDGTFVEGPDDITLKLLDEKLPENNQIKVEDTSTEESAKATPSNQLTLGEQIKIDKEEKNNVEYNVQGNLVLRRVLNKYNFQNEQDIDIFSLNGEFIRHCKRFFTEDEGDFKRILDDGYNVVLLDSNGQEMSPDIKNKSDRDNRYISEPEDDGLRRLIDTTYFFSEGEACFFRNDLWYHHSKPGYSIFDPREVSPMLSDLEKVEMRVLNYEGEAISETYKYISDPDENGNREAVDFFNRPLTLTKGEDGFFHEAIDNQVEEN